MVSQSRTKELFANRFEPDGDDYTFRANPKSAGIRVSKNERDAFVEDFNKRIDIATWGGAIVIVPLVVGVSLVLFPSHESMTEVVIFLAAGLYVAAFLVYFRRLWNAPVTALRDRTPTVDARSVENARRLALQRLTWAQLGGAFVMCAALLFRVGIQHNLLIGWYRLWLVGAGAMLVLLTTVAFRKWKLSRSTPETDPTFPES